MDVFADRHSGFNKKMIAEKMRLFPFSFLHLFSKDKNMLYRNRAGQTRSLFLAGGVFLFLALAGCGHKPSARLMQPLKASWQFKKAADTVWHGAEVPGTVHTDLLKNHLIPDPYYGTHEVGLQWIGKTDWVYRAHFDVPLPVFRKKHIALFFKGLDTYATVKLNGHLLLRADNMFRHWEVDVKPYLKKNGNILTVLFRSPLHVNKDKVERLPYVLPADNDRSDIKVSVFTRKAPYQFGWDWGPRFVTCGIWRPILWDAWDDMKISDFQIYQQKVSDTLAQLRAVVEIESSTNRTAVIQLLQNDTSLLKKRIRLPEGTRRVVLLFKVKNPRLWWTNGLGKSHLYRFSVRLYQTGTVADKKTVRFGIRTLEIVQKPDTAGSSFFVKLNGVPVFMKGANYIPQDNFLPRVTKQKYERLIRAAKRTHMNMLRVWGGGIYENDEFYDLCDENGILVWQDFMFACSFYPGDSAFLNNVRHEAVQNVKRLRNHPCLALWCGNNEIRVAWERWGYQKKYHYTSADCTKIYGDYLHLFRRLLPSVVHKYDSGRFYWPSSPNSAPEGWAQEARSGDMHYWGVWWGRQPFSAYERYVGRFMSEYGFQSLPAYATIARFAPDTSRYLVSPVMRAHNKHPAGYQIIRQYMQRDFHVPENFKNYILVSQLLQAEGMKTAIEAHRRARPWCMGSLFWQLDDCWPVVSWSGIDYYGRWKALPYYLEKLFAPVLVSPVVANGRLKVFLVFDLLKDKKVRLKMTLMNFYGKKLWQKEGDVQMKANRSQIVFSAPVGKMVKPSGKDHLFFHVEVMQDDSLLADNNLFFDKPKALHIPVSAIRYKIFRQNGQTILKVSSPVFVRYVVLQVPRDTGLFSDNYFSLLPGQVKYIRVKGYGSMAVLQKQLKIIPLY